jgi:MFS transporter, DHA2 family, methylenomycin A resistance protein
MARAEPFIVQRDETPRETSQPSHARTLAITLALAIGYVMAMLDATAVNVALDRIREEFGAPLSALVWVVDAYTLTFAALLLLGGSLADRVGAKRAYLLGLAWFILASGACALASSAAALIFARLFQGFGAALFMPSSMTLIGETFPDKRQRTKLVSVWGAVVAAAAGVGPFFGGSLITLFGWRSIFYLNIPIGILGIVLSVALLKPSTAHPKPFSVTRHGLFMVALCALSFTLIEGPPKRWFASQEIMLSALLTVVALAVVIWRELKASHPVVPISLRQNGRFWAYNHMGFCVNFTLFGEIFILGLYLQQVRAQSPFMTGVSLLPVIGLIAVMSFLSGQVANRWGGHRAILIGFGCSTAGALLTALAGPAAPQWLIVSTLVLCNAGIGLSTPAIVLGIIHEAGPTNANIGSAMLNANRQFGSLAGVAAMGVLLQEVEDWTISIRLAFFCFALCMASAWLRAVWLSNNQGDDRGERPDVRPVRHLHADRLGPEESRSMRAAYRTAGIDPISKIPDRS